MSSRMEVMVEVPYRCPRCGGARSFGTLAEFRSHMAAEHAYASPRRQRLRIFDYSPPLATGTSLGRLSPLSQIFMEEGQRLERKVKAAKAQELKNMLERRKQAKRSKTLKPADLAPNSTVSRKVNFRTPVSHEPDAYLQDTVNQLNQDMLMQRQEHWRTADALYSTQDVLSGVEEAAESRVYEQQHFIKELTQQLAQKEQQLLALRTELQAARELDIEKKKEQGQGQTEKEITKEATVKTDNANNVNRERDVIEQELLKKKVELESLNKQIASAKQNNRRKVQAASEKKPEPSANKNKVSADRTSKAFREYHSADVSSQDSELSDYSTTQASMTLSRASSCSAKDRSNRLRQLKLNAPGRSRDVHRPPSLPHRHHNQLQGEGPASPRRTSPLERLHVQKVRDERRQLVHQMKGLLSRAATDNDHLKGRLEARETQLQALGHELKQSRSHQSELMEETVDLYRVAEQSLGQLRDRLRAKEGQLDEATSRLEQIRSAQQQLEGEKHQLVQVADDKELLYQNMMADRDQQIQTLNEMLVSQQEEREKLQEVAEGLKQAVKDKERMQQQLRQAITDKEQELQKAKEDVEALSKFLQTAASKESVARCKLEGFVTELIDRADRAERELIHLRGLESSNSGNMTASNPSLVNIFPEADVNTATRRSSLTQPVVPSLEQSTPTLSQNNQCRRNSRGEAEQFLQASLEPWYNDLGVAKPGPGGALGVAAGPESPSVAAGFMAAGVGSLPQQAALPLSNQTGPSQQGQDFGPLPAPPLQPGQQQPLPAQDLNPQPRVARPALQLSSTGQLVQPVVPRFNGIDPSVEVYTVQPPQPVLQPQPSAFPYVPAGPRTPSVNSQTPQYALTSQTPQYALNSQTPQNALISQTPQYALNSQTPQNALNSQTPQYALNSQTPQYALNSHNPQYALNSQLPQNGFNVKVADFNTNLSPLASHSDVSRNESSAYAALPSKRNNQFSVHPAAMSAVSRQSPAYDGGDEQACSDYFEGHPQKNCNVLVDLSGNVLPIQGTKSASSGQVLRDKPGFQSYNRASILKSDKHAKGALGEPKRDERSSSKSISPDKTYSIYCVTGEEARDSRTSDLSDSTFSHQDTPHFNRSLTDRRPRHRVKMRPVSSHLTKHGGRVYHYGKDSSTEGLDLSVDENGILWEAVDSLSEASDSYRMSPYGSETAGDVDTSVLLSSRSHGHSARMMNSRQDTDDDVDSLDDDGILRPSQSDKNCNVEVTSQEAAGAHAGAHLPLGERITRILKCVGRDEDSETLDRLFKKKGNLSDKKSNTLLYGTDRRSARGKTDSPLERALAVQDRVNSSLTFPRTKKKSVTICDSLSSSLTPPNPSALSSSKSKLKTGGDWQKRGNNQVRRNQAETFEPLEDLSSSSYASIQQTPRCGQVKPDWLSNTNNEVETASKNESMPLPGKGHTQGNASTAILKAQEVTNTLGTPSVNTLKEREPSQSSPSSHLGVSQQNVTAKQNLVAENKKETASGDIHQLANLTAHQTAEFGPSSELCLDQQSEFQGKLLSNLPGSGPKDQKSQSPQEPLAASEVWSNELTLNNRRGTAAIQRQPSISPPLVRQAPICEGLEWRGSAESQAHAQELRAPLCHSDSQSSLQSSENERGATSPPLPLPLPLPRTDRSEDDSTDFDLESDLEKFTTPTGAGMHGLETGTRTGRVAGKKLLLKKMRTKKADAVKRSQQLSAPQILDDNSSNMSDAEVLDRSHRHEVLRRRRVAFFCVFSYLDARSLCCVAQVCREWRRIARHPALWKHVQLEYERISSKFLVTLSGWCTQTASLMLEGLRAGSRHSSETMDEYHKRTRGCLEPGLEELLKASQNSMTTLSIVSCGNLLTDKCMWLVSGYCRLLERLTYLSDTHPLTAEVMWALGGGCPSITSLIIPPLFPCHNSDGMTNRCLMLIAQFYPDLLEVGVGGRSLDITGLVPLVQSCQRLLFMCVDHISEMGDDSATALCRAGLRQLQRLEVTNTKVTATAIKTFYSSCRHLKEIRVTVCVNDYFEDARKKKNKEEYKKVVKSLEELKSVAGLGNILQLTAAPVE